MIVPVMIVVVSVVMVVVFRMTGGGAVPAARAALADGRQVDLDEVFVMVGHAWVLANGPGAATS